MIFSRVTEYAIRGLSELAIRPAGTIVMLDDLVAGTENLPRDFLAKIFQRLVHANILRSVRGRNGGFALDKPAHDILLIDIVHVLEGTDALDRCVVGLTACNDSMPCPQHDLYKPIRQRLKAYLSSTTLADLASSLKSKQSWQKAQQAPEPNSAAVAST
jgi:Rrf2 family transcriptional regulator, iron-sulfur cluster assembly transcription factor